MKTLPTCIGLNVAGIPLQSEFAQKINTACNSETSSSSSIDTVYSYLYGINKMLSEAAQGSISWNESTTIQQQYPVYFIQEGMGANTNNVTLYIIPLTDVLSGITPPESYTEKDGKSYYKVAKVEMIVMVGEHVSYVVEMNVGVDVEIASPSEFTNIDWPGTFAPVLPELIKEINRLFSGNESSSTDNSDDSGVSISDTAISSITSEVDSSMLFIFGLNATKTAIEHYSYFRTLIANFTNQDLLIKESYQKDIDTIGFYNTLGLNTGDIEGSQLKAPETITCAAKNTEYQLVQMINMNVKGSKKLQGVGISYLLETTAGSDFASLIDIPFSRDNKINTATSFDGTAKEFWKAGGNSVKYTSASNQENGIQSSIAIDYLNGQHPSGNGAMAYFYSTINTFTNNH